MKKIVLILFGLLICYSVIAQQRNMTAIEKVYPRSFTSDLESSVNQQGLPQNADYQILFNKSGDLLKINVSSSANLFGIFTTDQRVVSALPEANMVIFGNRAGGSFGATGNDLRIAYSVDMGAEFTNFVINPQTGLNFRYPSTIVYNPSGNTDPANMFAIYSGPYTDAAGWKGQYFGSARIGGADVNTTFEDNEPTVYLNHLNVGLTATAAGNIHVASSRLNGTSAAYTSEGFEVLNGVFNSSTNQVDWELPRVKVQPELLDDGRIDAPRMVYSVDGSIGYLLCTAVDADNAYNPYGVEWPVVFKTLDNGQTWEKIEAFDFSEINTFKENLWPTRADENVIVPRWYNKWAAPENQSNNGATVDKNGNLHIAGLIRSTNSLHPDSLNYFYSAEPLLIFDVFMNGDGTWNAQFVDSIRSEGLEDYLTVSLDQRVSMSRSADGSKVFVTWADTDPTLWGAGVTTNIQPDVFIWGYDIETNHYTTPVNVTAFTDYWGDNFWLHVSDQVVTEGSDYYIPMSTSINGTTENDPVTHQYFSGVGFSEGDFVNVNTQNRELSSVISTVSQNFPNPFNGITEVKVKLSVSTLLSLEVYNLVGQKVFEIPAVRASAGMHKLAVDSRNLIPGVYTYSVIAGGERQTRKMIVL
ncbi:MAG: T9SS type A sorting domain-containing protein [Lentimicrobiaceae bacterium]|nr:T9SS type A sorting domain-containing protein [Lentimicrobiaceae bacterium]